MCPKSIQQYLKYTKSKTFTTPGTMVAGEIIFPGNSRRLSLYMCNSSNTSGTIYLLGPTGHKIFLTIISPNEFMTLGLADIGPAITYPLYNNSISTQVISITETEYLDGFFD